MRAAAARRAHGYDLLAHVAHTRDLMVHREHPKRRGRPPCVEGSAHRMALALSAAPLLGVELSAEDVLLERQAPPKLVHNVAVCSRRSPR